MSSKSVNGRCRCFFRRPTRTGADRWLENPAIDRYAVGAVASVVLGLAVGLVGCSAQDAYPSKPVVLICPWSPGGGTDRLARQVAAQLERELGVPVNVINATGGGGVTGHTRGALARPDGYTLTMATVELNMLHWRGLTDVSFRDFEPLVLLNRDEAAVFVRHDAPWKTIVELETAIRNRPGELKATGTARGGIWHIALAGWLDARGMPTDAVTWISINGAAPSLQELMADGVEMVCCSLPEARSLMDGGQLRCLGIMGDARLPAAPDVPTFPEAGIDWTLGGWRGIMFPERCAPGPRGNHARGLVARCSERGVRAVHGFGRVQAQVAGSEDFEQLLAERDEQFGTILSSPAFAQVSRSPLGPLVFPGLVVGLGVAVLLVLLWRGQLRLECSTAPLTRRQIARLAWVPAGVVFFALAADYAGFILAAGVMLLALLLALRVRVVTAAVLDGRPCAGGVSRVCRAFGRAAALGLVGVVSMNDAFLEAVFQVFGRADVWLIVIGAAVYGVFVGAIPGLTATMAVALFVPMTYWLDPVPALAAIVTMVACAIFAGDIPTVLLRIPGTPASAAYADDAYAFTRRGEADRPLSAALMCSVVGGIFGSLVLMLLGGAAGQDRHVLFRGRVLLALPARADLCGGRLPRFGG